MGSHIFAIFPNGDGGELSGNQNSLQKRKLSSFEVLIAREFISCHATKYQIRMELNTVHDKKHDHFINKKMNPHKPCLQILCYLKG